MRRTRDHYSDEEDVPLHYKKAFGSGLKRKKVDFVRAEDPDASSTINNSTVQSTSTSIGDLYASVVLKEDEEAARSRHQSSNSKDKASTPKHEAEASPSTDSLETTEAQICPVCSLPITTSLTQHEATLAHQVSVKHSHPPSALDRSRMGLRTLASHGWDPDARVGLGVEGDGMRYPIKVASKDDKMGIGAAEEAKRREEESKKNRTPKKEEELVKSLSTKELKALQAQQRKKAEVLQREIFGRGDLDKYLQKRDEWE